MKAQQFETLLGGSRALNLSPDAMFGLCALARREAARAAESDLLEAALRHASEPERRKLRRSLEAAEGSVELN